MRRTAALALALLLLAGCGGAERAPVAAETAAAYALESFELAGFPAVSGGVVYDCTGGWSAAVWPEGMAPLDTPEGARATSLASGCESGVWTLDRYWDDEYAEHVELCLQARRRLRELRAGLARRGHGHVLLRRGALARLRRRLCPLR